MFFFSFGTNSFAFEIPYDQKRFNSSGFPEEILKYLGYAYRDIGIEIDLKELPNNRSFLKIKSQSLDGDLGRLLPVIRKHRFQYVNVPLAYIKVCAFSNNNNDISMGNAVVVYERGYKIFDDMDF